MSMATDATTSSNTTVFSIFATPQARPLCDTACMFYPFPAAKLADSSYAPPGSLVDRP